MTPASLDAICRYAEQHPASPSRHVLDLLAEVERLCAARDHAEGVIADLLTDPGEPASAAYQAGAEEERHRLLDIAIVVRTRWEQKTTEERLKAGPVRGISDVVAAIAHLPPLPPPVPPETARRRAVVLTDMLRRVTDSWEHYRSFGTIPSAWAPLMAEARKLLEEK